MDQHPIPRQITSFEFKLIGFMTLKQFLYLAVSVPLGFVTYRVVPFPILNIILGIVVASIGAIFAFIPFQDRPIEEWIRNFIRRLNSPTQYFYHKQAESLAFLSNLYYASNPHVTLAHIESREKLSAYLQSTMPRADTSRDAKKSRIQTLFSQTIPSTQKLTSPSSQTAQPNIAPAIPGVARQPYLTGVVKNKKLLALPGILVTIKDEKGNRIRLLKSNPHGIFATYSPLAQGTYQVLLSDPNGYYFFDTMSIQVQQNERPTLTFFSKEVA